MSLGPNSQLFRSDAGKVLGNGYMVMIRRGDNPEADEDHARIGRTA